MMQSHETKKKDNRYLILIDDDGEVVAVEIKGFIDLEKIRNHSRDVAYYQ